MKQKSCEPKGLDHNFATFFFNLKFDCKNWQSYIRLGLTFHLTCTGNDWVHLTVTGRHYLVELLIGTRESMDSRVQAGLASPSPAFKGLVDSPENSNIGPRQVRLTHNVPGQVRLTHKLSLTCQHLTRGVKIAKYRQSTRHARPYYN